MTGTRSVTMNGDPLFLAGREVQVGDRAPDFTALDEDLNERKLSDLKGKIRVLVSVPSLDIPICDLQTRHLEEEASALGDAVRVLVVSMDLPFAQKRWREATGTERVHTLSDHRDASFGRAYGMLLPDLRLLARAVFVVDPDDVVRYVQVVPEITQEPDYDAVILAVKEML